MRRAAILAVACLAAAGLHSPRAQGQSSGGSLVAYRAEADSYGVSASVKVLRVLPLPVEVFAPRTRAQIDSQPRAIGFAAPVDIPLGELLGLLGIPVTPPTFCYGYFPATPENPADNQCGVVPFDTSTDGRGVRLLAGAGSVHTTGDAEDLTKLKVRSQAAGNFLQSPIVKVGTVSSESGTEVVDGVVQAHSTVALGSIDIGGIVKIDSIQSSAAAQANGTPQVTPPKAELAIGGMSVAGVPVRLTGQGLAIGKVPSLPLIPIVGIGVPIPDTSAQFPLPAAAVVRSVVGALNTAGITFGVLDDPVQHVNEAGTEAEAAVKGLVVGFEDAASGDFVQVRLGVATASVNASADSGQGDASSGPASGSTGETSASTGGAGTDELAAATGSPTQGADTTTSALGASFTPGSGAGGAPRRPGGRAAPSPAVPGLGPGRATPIAAIRIAKRLHGVYAAGALGSAAFLVAVALIGPRRRRAWAVVETRR